MSAEKLHSPHHEARNPDWENAIRTSFERQRVMALLGAQLGEVRPGYCQITLPYRHDLTQQHGYFHAGITSTVVDSAAGYAGLSVMPAGCEVLSVEFKINMLAPGDGELLITEGHVVKAGKTLVITRGEAYVRKGDKLTHCASMQQTLMTMYPRKDAQ